MLYKALFYILLAIVLCWISNDFNRFERSDNGN